MPSFQFQTKITLVCLLCLAFLSGLECTPASAQRAGRDIVDQPLEWFSLTSTIDLSNKLSLMVEGQFRYARDFEPMQYQARSALEVKLGDHFVLVPLGYVYTWNYRYGKQPSSFENNEHRIWQQLFYKNSYGRFLVDHRLRFEQRFIQRRTVDDGDIMYHGHTNRQFRMRYRFMARWPLNNIDITPGTWVLAAYDEVFMSFGKPVTFHEPDQNRIFVGVGYQFDERLSVLPGFLYQMLIKDNGVNQENNVGVQVMFTYNIKKQY